ncbi:MAG: FAD-dependent oxidoreductase [Acidobacteriota bacterium]
MSEKRASPSRTRRDFIKQGSAAGVGAIAAVGFGPREATAAQAAQMKWHRVADVVVVGAGAAGLPAAITARDLGASVIVIEENDDIGGHAMVSGGILPLGGGTRLQKKYGISDSADQVYLDHTNHKIPEGKFGDRDLIRVWADENLTTVEFMIDNGVTFQDREPTIENGGSVPRRLIATVYSTDLKETINGRAGSGIVRPLEKSARSKGVEFLLRHKMTRLVREKSSSGKVVGIVATVGGKDVAIRARKGVVLATGGHSSNVAFRRMFDPRLTEEYQTAGLPYSRQDADGEIAAMELGAALWATGNQASENDKAVTKTQHIGCRWGYVNLKWKPESPVFHLARASGLTVTDFQNVILVNQVGVRFWNEADDSYAFINACLGTNGNLGRGKKANGGGPIWAIFDSEAVKREKWIPMPPQVDPDGWFFSAETLAGLAARIVNPHQLEPLPARALEQTVATYNSHVDQGKDPEFGKPAPKYKIQAPPFYAAWSTPIVHDTQTGLKTNTKCQVIDIHDKVIAGLYAAGEVAGGFELHGLPRVMVFGRIAGREAARDASGA